MEVNGLLVSILFAAFSLPCRLLLVLAEVGLSLAVLALWGGGGRYRRGKGPGHDQLDAAVDCMFCMSRVDEGEEVRELRCCHVFHRAYLDAWLVHPRATCPLYHDRILPSDPPRACGALTHDDLSTSSASYPTATCSGTWMGSVKSIMRMSKRFVLLALLEQSLGFSLKPFNPFWF